MQVAQLFKSASDHFEDNNYLEGLELITHCIIKCPNNSLLYSNRALFYAQLGDLEGAYKDLNHAIALNHLNYVAYFNLFSLQYRSGQQEISFENLCCSLSCLYLIRAKKSRRQLDVQKSIKYSENNIEAHVLKSLMYLEDGKLKLALNQIEWAIDISTHSILCRKIRNFINKKLNPHSIEEFIDEAEQNQTQEKYRLKTTYEPNDEFMEEIQTRVNEFNEIYEQLNSQYGTVTQKVPRVMLENDKTHLNNSKSNLLGQLSQIYEIKFRDSRSHEAPVTSSQVKVHSEETKQQPNENQEESLLLLEQGNNSIENEAKQASTVKADNSKQQEDNLLDDSLNQPTAQFRQYPLDHDQQIVVIEANQSKLDKTEENLLDDDKVEEKHQIKIQMAEQSKYIKLEQEIKHEVVEQFLLQSLPKQQLKPAKNQVTISKMSQTSSATTNESVNLYPITDKKKIQFTVIGAQIKNPGTYKDLYLTGNYNSRKGLRLKTNIKKLQGNTCKWYSASSPTPISQVKQTVSVKVYCKQYFSYLDDLIGEGEVQVIRSGELKFPIYFKNKTTGFVSLRVDLI